MVQLIVVKYICCQYHMTWHHKTDPAMIFGVFLFVLASSCSVIDCSNVEEAYFNVMDYGATSNGYTDDSQAFLKAWEDACNASSVKYPTVYIPPQNIFLVNPITFEGPCNSSTINFLISGTILGPNSPTSWEGLDPSQWIVFKNVNGLNIDGVGLIDAQGKAWWDQSCRYHPQLKGCTTLAPTAWKFLKCRESSVRNVKLINSAQTHILLEGCENFIIERVIINSPEISPNTDGIHIQASKHVLIVDSKIASGDDCISIGDHILDIEIGNIECGPGHGISIGSLGRDGSYAQVENIHVNYAFFNGTTNGVRIKTWQGGRGYVRGVTFENLVFTNTRNPIIIDQNYCNISNACAAEKNGVQISNVVYREAIGTSASAIAINLNCSKAVPCSKISLESIQLTSITNGSQVTANCTNVSGQEVDVAPGPCLRRS